METPNYYNNDNGSLYKVATERGWNSYLFDIVKRLERGGKKDPLTQEIDKTINVLKLWKEELCEPEEGKVEFAKTKEERFADLISGIDISSPKTDFDKYPNTLFWFDKDGNCICEYNFKNKQFWFNYYKIWSVFEDEFSMGSNEIEDFTKIQVEYHFKIKDVTTELL